MKKILVIAESIDVEDSSGSKANVALIENLHSSGALVKVLHYTRKGIHLNGIECVAISEKRWTPLFFLSRTERYLRYFLKLQLNKPLEKLFGFSFTLFNDRNSIISSIKEITDFNPDYVLTLSKGGSFRPHHALLKIPELHEKWIAYIHDPYPAHLYPRPFAWVEPGYHQKWKFVRDVSEKAAICAFPSEMLMEWMGSYFPGFKKKGIVIPHQLRKENFADVPLPDYFEKEKFNILHAGTLLGARNPSGLIRAYNKFLINEPSAKQDARLLFLGNNELFKQELQKYEKEVGNNFYVRAYEEYPIVRQLQNSVSVNVILEAKSEISPFLPGKFPHCIEANKPILLLGPPLSESRRLLGNDYPYWAEIDDEKKIAGLLSELYHKWKKGEQELQLERRDIVEYLSADNLANIIQNLEKK